MDLGLPGPDAGNGGTHLIVPPHYKGTVPSGMHTAASSTNRVMLALRAIPQDSVTFELKDQKSAGEMRPAGDSVADQYRYVVMPMRI